MYTERSDPAEVLVTIRTIMTNVIQHMSLEVSTSFQNVVTFSTRMCHIHRHVHLECAGAGAVAQR